MNLLRALRKKTRSNITTTPVKALKTETDKEKQEKSPLNSEGGYNLRLICKRTPVEDTDR